MEERHGRQRIHDHCWIDWDRQGVWRFRQFIPLPPRTFRILAYLVTQANRVVTLDELCQVGWNESRTVWDLQPHIHRIRVAIETQPHRPRWLVTRRAGGYLLRMDPHAKPA